LAIQSLKKSGINQFSRYKSMLAGNPAKIAFNVEYLVIAGGGGGGNGSQGAWDGLGGGAGGYRSSVSGELSGRASTAENFLFVIGQTNYEVTVGAGGPSTTNGVNSKFSIIESLGGGRGGSNLPAGNGGSGGGAAGLGTTGQGFDGGPTGGGGGGAGESGDTDGVGQGGDGIASNITGSSIIRAGGGGTSVLGASQQGGDGGGGTGNTNGQGTAGASNTGGGGGGSRSAPGSSPSTHPGGAGGSGVVILRYSNARTITIGSGLTGTTATVGSDRVTTITAGTGNVSWA